jgi:hypothetical protein
MPLLTELEQVYANRSYKHAAPLGLTYKTQWGG